MTTVFSISILAAIAACFLAAAALRSHGLAGVLYLLAAWLWALADAIKAGQDRRREGWALYRRQAEEAAR